MEIQITPAAIHFFKEDMNVPSDKGIQIKGKTYGSTNVHNNFSVAINVKAPSDNPYALIEKDGLTVFVEQSDSWFVEGLDLQIDFDDDADAPTFFFTPNDGMDLDSITTASKKKQQDK